MKGVDTLHAPAPTDSQRETHLTDRLLTADEVAALLSLPMTWVYRAARENTIPSVKLGRYVRFDADDIARWIADQKTASR